MVHQYLLRKNVPFLYLTQAVADTYLLKDIFAAGIYEHLYYSADFLTL